MKIADILQNKEGNVYKVSPQTSVLDTLRYMGEKNIGAVVVMEGEELKGIFSERDYARKVVLKGRSSHDTQVSEIMTEKVITVYPEDTIERCMELMSGKRIRHLPVVKGDKVIGVVSIGDVVTAIIEMQKETIDHLKNYISQ